MPSQHRFVRAPSRVPGIAAVYGYEIDGQSEGVHLGMPSGSLTVVISLDNPVEVAEDADRWRRGETSRHGALVAGLNTRPTYIRQPVRQRGIQLALHPLAARRLLGMPTAELAQRTWAAEDVLGIGARELRDRLHEIDTWSERLAVVDAYFAARTGCRSPARPEVSEAWRRLYRSGGAEPIAQVAAGVPMSQRRLSALIERELGIGAKTLARLMRFDRAVADIGGQVRSGRIPVLADVASRCGYYDQSHLAREFQRLTDRPPSRYLAEEFQNIQAGGHQPPTESSP